MKVAIIGGGPAGLTAAYFAKGEVYVFDKNGDVGKKLLLTGNGKCNYWNQNQQISKYHSYSSNLLKNIITDNNLNETYKFLESIGIVPKIKNGYYYPFSGKSTSVKSSLKKACLEKGAIFRLDECANLVEFRNGKFIVNGEEFDKVVVATGGMSYPKTGSDGFGYNIAKSFNHHIFPVNPSLMSVVTDVGLEKSWAGIRCDVEVSLYEDDNFLKNEVGELQFTSNGLSGICVFNLSRDIRIGLNNKKSEKIHINFTPWYDGNDFYEFLESRNESLNGRNITELCDGFIDYKILMILLKYKKIDYTKSWSDLRESDRKKVVNILRDFTVNIIDTGDFSVSQTTSGGISLEELDLNTLQSLKQKGLYFCGEVVDVDGDCGGYNLTFAFLSGMLVGRDIND